jgi:hypothetical protein
VFLSSRIKTDGTVSPYQKADLDRALAELATPVAGAESYKPNPETLAQNGRASEGCRNRAFSQIRETAATREALRRCAGKASGGGFSNRCAGW